MLFQRSPQLLPSGLSHSTPHPRPCAQRQPARFYGRRTLPILSRLTLLVSIVVCSTLDARSDFANFETPQVKPITTALVGIGADQIEVVLVCNTPDNSVEIYEADAPHRFLQRVPVGLGPVTVRWFPGLQRFYTCNFDGDSVSAVRMELVSPSTGSRVRAFLERTTLVGDQPSDIAFDPTGVVALVTLSGRSSVAILNQTDLSPIAAESLLEATDPAIDPLKLAVKAPRRIEWLADDRVFVQNIMGESPNPNTTLPTQYDLDMWFLDSSNPNPEGQINGLGSTNHGFAMTSDGSIMVVVGTKARNHDAVGEAAVAALEFGFVESRVWIIDTPLGGQPTVRPEAASGAIPVPPVVPLSRNLNRDYSTLSETPVKRRVALSQPTDVIILETPSGEIDRLVVTAYHSDKITFLTPGLTPGGYFETQLKLPVLNRAGGYTATGPRGLAHSASTGLIYVACRLDNTLRVIDPNAHRVTAAIALQNDPTPQDIRAGRAFLYNATETSGNGFVSCASCHIDATTDGLDWDLGDFNTGPLMPPGIVGAGQPGLFTEWPSEKGPIITQTLQGLVNFRVNDAAQYLFTNAPYHWRGDRANFQAFNVAFPGLLGRDQELTTAEINAYTSFINTVRHPSNPEQAIDRRVPGTLDPVDPDDPTLASGAKRGLQIFHNAATDGSLGCVGCHSLPDGSDNTLTDAFNVQLTLSGSRLTQLQPFETAALRNLVPREVFLHRAPGLEDPLFAVGNVGLTHNGNIAMGSINFFNNFFFSNTVPGATPDVQQENLDDLTRYTRQFDWSTAPAAGLSYTLDPTDDPFNLVAFNFFEEQVNEANIGLAIIARTGVDLRGFWYDITVDPPAYREEGTMTWLSRDEIEDLADFPDSAVILQGTPLGNERRIANPLGVATLIADVANAPQNIASQPMAPMTYHTDIPLFKGNLNVNQAVDPAVVTLNPINTLWAVRTLQLSALGDFGVEELHHIPPRRMRVTGDNIRPGAKLLVGIPTTIPGDFPVQVMELDLFPTVHTSDAGDQIWETEQELDALVQFVLLNGGPFAPDVTNVALRQTTTPALDPQTWNSFGFAVLNADGTLNTSIPFVPLTVQDVR